MIADADIPAETVRAFAAHMSKEFGVTIGRTPALIQAGLRLVGMKPERYATTVGKNVYFPIELGATQEGWSAWDQISVLTHECQHAIEKTDLATRAVEYLGSSARRTEIECRAFAAQLALHFWRYGEIEPWWPRVRVESLKSYHVTTADLAVAERYLKVHAPVIRDGGLTTAAGAAALEWLEENAPELRHPSRARR